MPASTAQESDSDLQAAIDYGRHLEAQLIILKGDLQIARSDSLTNARLYAVDIMGKDQQIAWLKDQLPRFYERPLFVGGAVMVVTIWAVLKAIQISL